MNKWLGTGRLTKSPVISNANGTMVARFTLAVNRRFKKDGQDNADFISCVAFGKTAEWVEKYVQKGTKIEVDGRIQTGSYEKDGVRHYTTDIVVENADFAESKKASEQKEHDGFINVPEGVQGALPFN